MQLDMKFWESTFEGIAQQMGVSFLQLTVLNDLQVCISEHIYLAKSPRGYEGLASHSETETA